MRLWDRKVLLREGKVGGIRMCVFEASEWMVEGEKEVTLLVVRGGLMSMLLRLRKSKVVILFEAMVVLLVPSLVVPLPVPLAVRLVTFLVVLLVVLHNKKAKPLSIL